MQCGPKLLSDRDWKASERVKARMVANCDIGSRVVAEF